MGIAGLRRGCWVALFGNGFLVKSRLGLPLLATRALLVYPPARGEQGDGPMDNEGFYVDNEGNMVHGIRTNSEYLF